MVPFISRCKTERGILHQVKFVVQLLYPWRCRHYCTCAQILGASAAGRQHFVPQRPVFVGTRYGTSFMSRFGRL